MPLKLSLIATCLVFLISTVWTTGAIYREFHYEDREDHIAITGYDGESDPEVVIPGEIEGKPVRVIVSGAFFLGEFKVVRLAENITTIEEHAFSHSDLVHVFIPSTVNEFYSRAFFNCPDLETIEVDEQNPWFATVEGAVFSKDLSELIYVPYQRTVGGESYQIPESVVSLGDQAFYASSVTKVIFPQGLLKIGSETFQRSRLESITIPATVTEMGLMAFRDCNFLTSIDVEANHSRFSSVDGVLLETATNTLIQYPKKKPGASYIIPDGIEKILEGSFQGPDELKEITIPTSLETIEPGSLFIAATSFVVEENNPAFTSVDGAIFSEDLSVLIRYPQDNPASDYLVPDGVKTIAPGAFFNSSFLVSVTIPEGVTTIAKEAFRNCRELMTVSLPSSLQEIKDDAFRNCGKLITISLPDNLESIGAGAFWLCRDLLEVTIPVGVTELQDNTFNSCAELNAVELPDSLREIGDGVFANCAFLQLIQLPAGLLTIGNQSFIGCRRLEEVSLPDTLQHIGEEAFMNCFVIDSITIPPQVSRLEHRAFFGCNGFSSVHIPEMVNFMGNSVFSGCGSLEEFTVADANLHFATKDGVLFSKDATRLIQFPVGKSLNSYSIPEGVLYIDDFAFQDASMEEIHFPTSLKSIGVQAFGFCKNLNSAQLPEGLSSLGELAFRRCSNLKTVNIPSSLPHLSGGVFYENESLVRVNIPSDIAFIAKEAFYRCSGLEEVILEKGVKYIGNGAFRSCSLLSRLILSEGLEEIDERAFELCPELLKIQFPDGLRRIGAKAFGGCNLLDSIRFPNTLESIGEYAFENCDALTSVTFPESLQWMGGRAFILANGIESFYFLGDAPEPEGVVFSRDIDGGTVYFFDDAEGFTQPTWADLPTVNLGPRSGSIAWLIENNLNHETDLASDPIQFGYPLLVNYALNQNLGHYNPPLATVSEDDSTFSFFGAREDVTYTVEISKDLTTWTTTGVTLSEPEGDGMRTASVNLEDGRCFVRFRFEAE